MRLSDEEIRRTPSRKLLDLLREDIDLNLHDKISYELFEVREAGKGEDLQANQ